MNQTIYFRKDIWLKLQDEPEKSKLINNLLESHYRATPYDNMPKVAQFSEKKPVVSVKGVSRGAEFVPKPPDPEFGYPCCKARRPCKHWAFDGLTEAWTNVLTGKTRVVQ